ncbi:hypothetical protein FQN54_008092 [Arachnomyces sp. PD_36]|nr:hypothetical protein FQN54_008092 [Arachnomyces sp. PD_36]
MPGAMKPNGKAPATQPTQTPPTTPIDESPQHCIIQQPVTRGELKDLLVEVIHEARATASNTSADPVTREELKDLLLQAIHGKESSSPSQPSSPPDKQETSQKDESRERVRASKLKYKTVEEVYALI